MKTKIKTSRRPVPTRTQLLRRLKQWGPSAAEALAAGLNVTPMAVRQHLYELQKSGFVDFETEARPMGRPAKLWKLNAAADLFFADRHAELSVGLLKALEASFGKPGLERLLKTRTRQQIETYRKSMSDGSPTRTRLRTLARLRTAEGYMAEVQPGSDGSLLLIENHCPICAAADSCRGLCESEMEVFQSVLGEEVQIERTEHIVSKGRRCVYKVTGRSTDPKT